MAEASGVSSKVLRSLGVGRAGKTTKEREFRAKTKDRIIREMIPYSGVKGKPGVLPGFGPHEGFDDDEQIAIRVSHSSLIKVAEKVARGCEFILAKRYVEPPYGVRTYFVETTPDTIRLFASAKHTDLGPGFQLSRIAAEAEDPKIVLYRALIWGTFTLHTAIDIESVFKP